MNDEIDFIRILKEKKPKIYEKILEYLPDKFPEEHYKMVREYPERQGKYFRPVMVLLANEMFGGKEEDAIITSAGMQISEDWLLIHDDVEDESEERRGKPALNKMYHPYLALNAGDALHMIMWNIFFDNLETLEIDKAKRIFRLMMDILLRTAEGQYMEISWIVNKKLDVTEEEYYQMIDRKTAAYTIYGPLQLGATVAGATGSTIASIKDWGVPFGRAFQIHDDVLNLVADQEKMGKEVGGDILEGKRTLMLIHLLANCTQDEKNKIVNIYLKQRKDKTEEEKVYVMNMMKRYGSIQYAHQKSLEYAEQAKTIFNKSTSMLKDTFAKKAIMAGIDFVVKRDK